MSGKGISTRKQDISLRNRLRVQKLGAVARAGRLWIWVDMLKAAITLQTEERDWTCYRLQEI